MPESESVVRVRARRAEVYAQCRRLVDGVGNRELTDPEQRSYDGLMAQLDGLDSRIAELAEQAGQAAAADAAMARLAGAGQDQLLDAPPPLLPSPAPMQRMFEAVRGGESRRFEVLDEETRAAITLSLTGTPSSAGIPRSGLEPRRLAVSAGLSTRRVSGVEGVVFPIFGAGNAAVAAEGAAKPEYTAITPGTAAPHVISNWTDYTRQVALTQLNFEQRLRQQLATNVAVAEDSLIITKVLATTGIQTFAKTAGVPASDALLQAAGLILWGSNTWPTTVALRRLVGIRL